MVLARAVTITTANKTNLTSAKSLVWDIPTRLFHWLLVFSLAGSWITAEAGFDWTETHFLFGYTSIGLVVFRIIWGIAGSTHARFANFLARPKEVLASIPTLFSRRPSASVGHSPIGGLSTILMIVLVGIQATTGLFISDDIFYAGPYNGIVSSKLAGNLAAIHHANFIAIQVTVCLHIVAVLWYQFGKSTDVIKPMLHGRKSMGAEEQKQSIAHSFLVRGLITAAIVACAVVALVQLAPPPPVVDYF